MHLRLSSLTKPSRWTGWISAIFIFAATIQSAEAKRVALVIGNDGYTSEAALGNARGDAEALAGTLTSLGFDVLLKKDLDREGFAETLLEFETQLQGADIAAFYYAGHGIQFDGRNYLLPTDAVLSNRFMFSAETLPLDAIIESMSRHSQASLVFLDACRDNPFVGRLKGSLPASRSAATTRGLARLSARPNETIVVYATSPDSVALDGDGEHSPFAQALINHLPTPETEIGLVMRRVIGEVREATDGRQSPEVTVSLSAEIYLNIDVNIGAASSSARPEPRANRLPKFPTIEPDEDVNAKLESMWADGIELSNQGDDKRYYEIMKAAYDIALAVYGPDSHQYAQANNHMVGALSHLGRTEDAVAAAQEAIRVFEALYGPKSTRVANDKANLAARLNQLGRVDEAESAYREAIAIYEGARRMGWDHTGYATALSGYGRFLADAGEPKEGLELAYKAVDVLETTGRVRDRHYGWALLFVAELESTFGTCEEAENFYRKAKDAFAVAGLGSTHKDVRRSNQMIGRGC